MSGDDFIEDLRRRYISMLVTKLSVSEPVAALLAAEICNGLWRDWAGERPYIPKAGENSREVLSERNRAIIRDWRGGERICFLARKYKISRQRVWQVVRGV